MSPTRRFVFKKAPEGFTLVELLVVLAVIALLAVMLLPAIAATKPNSQGFQCLNNEKQLTLAWQMYAEDNADLLAPNDYPFETAYRTYPTQFNMRNWVVGTMEQAADVVSPQELTDPNTVLSTYVTNPAVYRCPADLFPVPTPGTGGRLNPRSYSMNSAVGTLWWTHFQNPAITIGTPVQGGWLPGRSYNTGQNTWLTYGKITSFTRPGPANTFVLMDENPLSINDGSIAIPALAAPGSTFIIDWVSGNHDGNGCISFADGHVIVHRWLDSRTFIIPLSLGQHGMGGQGQVMQTPDNTDCFYLASITSALR